jgi:hypothetical protein
MYDDCDDINDDDDDCDDINDDDDDDFHSPEKRELIRKESEVNYY